MLKREMSSFGGLLITLSCLSPSIGVFICGNDVLHQVGSGAFPCFVAAVIMGVAMSAVYAELSSAFPHTGGEYTMAGRTLGPAAGFGLLSINLFSYPIALALSSLGVADYLRAVWPWLQPVPTAMVIIIAVTAIAALSIRMNALITGLFLAIEIFTLCATAALGLAHVHPGNAALLVHPAVSDGGAGLHGVGGLALGVAASSAIYAFNGYGAVVFLGEEIRNARASVGAVVYWALAIAAFTELVPLVAIIVSARDFPAFTASASPIPDFFRLLGGPGLSQALSLAVASAIFNTMIAVALVGGRQIYASGRDRCWPEAISAQLERVHPRFNSPWIATLLLGTVAFVVCLMPGHTLLIIIGNGNVVIYAMLALGVLAGRRNGSTRRSLSRAPLHPLAPMLVLLALGGVVWADLLDPVTGRIGLLVAVLMFSAGAADYWFRLRRSAVWAFRGPEEDVLP